MAITSASALVDALRDYRILSTGQLDTLSRSSSGLSSDPRTLARDLVQRGWVTTFQANLLNQGRGSDLVLGEYLLLERLGQGGMGQVFKARHQLMNRIVALKVIPRERLANPELVQRFLQEIQAAARLSHPHIVTAYDAQQVNGTHILVMEYVEGKDLHSLVQKQGPLPVGQACGYILQAALGLQHAAAHRLVHRDIKPSNLQVTADGMTVKILDLGLARLQDGGHDGPGGLTRAHTVMGTPDYIAPEQIADARSVDARADIYSLGCTLYFLLAGRAPYASAQRWEEKLVCHGKSEPQPIEQLRSDVPPAVGAILRKMMARRPDDRYPSPAAVAEALMPYSTVTRPAPVAIAVQAGPDSPPGSTAAYPVPSAVPVMPASPPPGWAPEGATTVAAGATPTVQHTPATPASGPTVLVPTSLHRGPGLSKWLLGGLALLLVSVGVATALLWPKGDTAPAEQKDETQQAKGSPPAPELPIIFVDEDFRDAFKNKLNVPPGWKDGEAFRIVAVNEEPCLEVGLPNGVAYVTLPPVKLTGDFFVEGAFNMSYNHRLTFQFEDRKSGAFLPVVIDATGSVMFADDLRVPLPSYKPFLPTRFQILRKDSKMSVALNGDVVAVKDLGKAASFESLKLGMTAGHQYPGRLYRLKVGTLVP